MKPQELNLNCELFDEFRQALDHAVRIILVRMIEKGLDSGSIVGKLDISLRVSPTEDGEMRYLPEIQPDVQLKIGSKAKLDCTKQIGFLAKPNGRGIVIGTDQVTMDELIGEMDE